MDKCKFCQYRWNCKVNENGICLIDKEMEEREKERYIQQSKSDVGD